MKKTVVIILLSLTYSAMVSAKKLAGKITDSGTGIPIIGASVYLKGSSVGTVSDADGMYILEVSDDRHIVAASYVGYDTQEKVLDVNQKTLDFALVEKSLELSDVVVVGYGVEKKKLSTGATVNIKGDAIQSLNTTNALGALQSQSAGVNIKQSSGMPGQGFMVTIRGLGTNGNSAPLYVIDGIVGADINSLNPADIESIDVLKDAASSAIYGSRAANGVILVTTKQGKTSDGLKNTASVTYDGSVGIQNVYKTLPMLNAQEYMTIQDEVRFNEGVAAYDWATLIPDLYNRVQNGWEGTSWLKEITNKNALTTNHALNMTGGSARSNYSVGLSYTLQDGILGKPVDPSYDRYTFRLNSEHILIKKEGLNILKFGENVNYSYHTNKGIAISNMWSNDIRNAITATPLMPVYNENGEYFNYDDILASGYDKVAQNANPIAVMDYYNRYRSNKNHSLNANLFFEIQPIKNLIYRSSFGYRLYATSTRGYVPEFMLTNIVKNDQQQVSQSLSLGNNLQWENTLSYSLKLNKNSINALLGQSVEKSGMGESLSINNVNYNFNDWEHAYICNTSGYTPGRTSYNGYPFGVGKLASFFGRLGYNYDEKYMATLVLRADGSSNFMRGKRWGYFPSVSAGWVVSSEKFMEQTSNVLDFLKLRASWGQNGNSSVPGFQYLATISYIDNGAAIHYPFGTDKDPIVPGAYPDILPNPDLSWETSDQINIGFDARFLNSRLGLTFDWYNKTTKDWLVRAPQLLSYGTGAPFINGGDVANKGIELGLKWNDGFKGFQYGAFVNLSYNKNEVLRIANDEGIINGPGGVLSMGTAPVSRIEVGYPMGFFWGYETAGVFQNNEQIANAKATLQENPQPGDLIFVDKDGNGVIDEKDKTMIGNPHPDFILGFGFNMSYKGFDLAMTANGSFGQQVMRSYRSFTDVAYQNYTTDIFSRWHGEGTSNRIPRLTSGGHPNWQEISDIYVDNSDYLRLQNITLGYDFNNLIKTKALGQLRVFVSAQNLFTITKYTGMDPEVGYSQDGLGWATGVDLGFYPSPRTYLMGVNLKF
ncbi:MAG: SusC/RagA family TonB-linked outer membrane protein [Bacteroidales bacterium]